MKSLKDLLKRFENTLNNLTSKLKDFSENTESKPAQPYSKIKNQPKFGNLDLVFDGNVGIWKTYAVYKDEPSED